MLKDKGSKITAMVVLGMFAVLAWFIAPLFLPVYRWKEVDFRREAEQSRVPQDELLKQHEINLFYNPRGYGDPAPWQIVDMLPEWGELNTAAWPKNDEYDIAMRCILISDRTGRPPPTIYIGSFDHDRYFTCKGWRFPPGALKQTSPRPIILYGSMSWSKLDKGLYRSYQQRKLDDGDYHYPEYDDEWEPADPNAVEELPDE